jgi:hypothetical protein
MRLLRRFGLVAVLAVVLAACGSPAASSTATPTASASLTSRPSSPVKIVLVSPTNGEVVHGTTVHVVVRVEGGTISRVTSSHITPTAGHVHLYFNNQLVYMSYTLHQDLPVHAGLEYTMYAEFVAQDHLPFNPRDVTPTLFFKVAP